MTKNSVLLYKGKPCILKDFEKDKIIIELEEGSKKVREKDAILLVENVPSSTLSIKDVLKAHLPPFDVEDVIDLIEGEEHSLAELISLFCPDLEKIAYYNAWVYLSSSPFFDAISPDKKIRTRSKEEVAELRKKEEEKKALQDEAVAFADVLKLLSSTKDEANIDLERFSKFFQDIEEVALGKRGELKLMKNVQLNPEKAHGLLLKSRYWSPLKNPYPYRYNKIVGQAKQPCKRCEEKTYVDLTHLKSYAIDNEETSDPDDAISYDGNHLWIHIALVADSVENGSEYDEMLQARGRSLYLPDGVHYMMGKVDTETFAIGLEAQSYALSIKIKLQDDATIENVEVMRAKIAVERLTYSKATTLKDSPYLKPFFDIAKANYAKRERAGAVSIDIPEVEVRLKDGEVRLIPHIEDDAFKMIKEMMLLAGEGVAFFAFKNNIPFQYISQASPSNMPKTLLSGLCGEFQKRRYMKGRSVSTMPASHSSLGLSMYSQITSPMRRYGDLISQKQLLSYIDGSHCTSQDELFAKIALADLSFRDGQLVERSSKKHFLLVYLLQHPDWKGEALIVGMQQDGSNRAQIYIEELGLESQLHIRKQIGETVRLKVLDVDLPNLDVTFKEI